MELKRKDILKNVLIPCIIILLYITYIQFLKYDNDAVLFFIFFISFIEIMFLEEYIPNNLKKFLIILFLIKSIISYIIMVKIISPFPDSFLYLDNLEMLREVDSISYNKVTAMVGSLHVGYEYLMVFIDWFFKSMYSHYLTNIFISNISLIYLYKLIKRKFSSDIAFITTILTGLSMTFNIFTVNILKDPMVLFLTILSIYLCDLFFHKEENKRLNFIMFIIFTTILTLTRIYTGFSVFIIFILELIVNQKTQNKGKNSMLIKLLIFFSIILIFIIMKPYVGMLIRSFKKYFKLSSLFYGAKGIFRMFFSPLPWNMLNRIDIYSPVIIDSTLLLLSSFALIKYVIKCFEYEDLFKNTYMYLVIIITHGVVLGISYDGSSIRQRIAVFPFIILIYLLGIFYKSNLFNKVDTGGN